MDLSSALSFLFSFLGCGWIDTSSLLTISSPLSSVSIHLFCLHHNLHRGCTSRRSLYLSNFSSHCNSVMSVYQWLFIVSSLLFPPPSKWPVNKLLSLNNCVHKFQRVQEHYGDFCVRTMTVDGPPWSAIAASDAGDRKRWLATAGAAGRQSDRTTVITDRPEPGSKEFRWHHPHPFLGLN